MIKRCDKGQLLRPEVLPKTEESETDSEIDTNLSKSKDLPVKAEEMVKYACETDDESALD